MKSIAAIGAVLSFALLGCASGTRMQAECESKFREFPDIFQCTYDAIAANNPSILQDPRAKLYMLRGEQLAVAVSRHQMSSLDAKVEWQKEFLNMKAGKDQEDLAAVMAISAGMQAGQAAAPAALAPAAPRLGNAPVNCTSSRIGSNVYTNCN